MLKVCYLFNPNIVKQLGSLGKMLKICYLCNPNTANKPTEELSV